MTSTHIGERTRSGVLLIKNIFTLTGGFITSTVSENRFVLTVFLAQM
jgi:hypothetical protein